MVAENLGCCQCLVSDGENLFQQWRLNKFQISHVYNIMYSKLRREIQVVDIGTNCFQYGVRAISQRMQLLMALAFAPPFIQE